MRTASRSTRAVRRSARLAAAILALFAVATTEFAAERASLPQAKAAKKVARMSGTPGAGPLRAAVCAPATIPCDTTVAGTLTSDDCVLFDQSYYDVWQFQANAGDHVRITMAAGFDTYLYLYNPNGTKVDEDDDSGGGPDGTNSRIDFAIDMTGTWTIYANSYDPFTTGLYSLDLDCTPSGPPPTCTANATTLCLNAARFRVQVSWRVPTQGTSGVGTASALTSDTGYFWFFSSNNVELVIKVVDGRAFNQYFWVFYGALSDVEYTITVTDTVTGAVKTYTNPQGRLASVADVTAFPGGSPSTSAAPTSTPGSPLLEEIVRAKSREVVRLLSASAPAVCLSDATTLCLNNGRFQVRVAWRVPTQGTSGVGLAVPLTSDTGYFWFFSSNNVELVIKVVDGRAFNGFFWVFYGALSDVEYTITVTDTDTGAVKTYTNPQGRLASVADVAAFPS